VAGKTPFSSWSRAVRLAGLLAEGRDATRAHMTKYASVPMSLADACLVRMSELHAKAKVLTLDSDFRIYRRNRRQSIPGLSPR
jgi:predicted nucleic acid-binding protein